MRDLARAAAGPVVVAVLIGGAYAAVVAWHLARAIADGAEWGVTV